MEEVCTAGVSIPKAQAAEVVERLTGLQGVVVTKN
jgi:hypothetical protein